MNKRYSILLAFSLLLLLLHSGCTEDKIVNGEGGGKHTVRLTLSVSTTPIPETKAVVQRALPGSEAEAAGFHYELVSSDTDTIATAVLTKAPSILKNVYALLFTSSGAFNGRTNLGTVNSGTAIYIEFTDVVVANATGCRLVIVANDNAAVTSYSSSGGTGGFTSFKGTYSDFQALAITSTISKDEDVPYAGSLTNVNLTDFSTLIAVPLYRTMARITLNNTFDITGGPARNSITLYNVGTRRFATTGNDNYNGTGSTVTTSYESSTAGSNANNNTWYVGENIQSAVTGITSIADRNRTKAPANACYIRIATTTSKVGNIPAVGEEYIVSDGSFTYDIYLGKSSDKSDFSLRRHTNYTITSNVSGTVAEQVALAASDGRVTLSKSGGTSCGLNIGKLAGSTSNVLLQPNTSGSTAVDNVKKTWADAITYCSGLTLGGVSAGTWYLPNKDQLYGICTVWRSELKGNSSFANYNAFSDYYYWSSTENNADSAWILYFAMIDSSSLNKANAYFVRCLRDLP